MVNLLPPEIKTRHKVRSKLYSVIVAYIVLAAIFVLGPIALATYNFIQDTQISNYQSEISQLKTQIGQSKDVNDKLAFIESRITSAGQYQEQRIWPEYLDIVADSTPASVLVNSIRLDDGTVATPVVIVTGTGTDRREIILFKDKIAEDELVAETSFDSISESVNDNVKTFNYSIRVKFGK